MSKIFEALQKARETSTGVLPAPLAERLAPGVASEPSAANEGASKRPDGDPAAEDRQHEQSIRAVPFRVAIGLPVFPFDRNHVTVAEQYRMIRTRIVQNVEPRKLIVVSSPDSGDGKTITTINIAGALALKSDINVLILDADLCRPGVAKTLGLPDSPGLCDVLRGTCALRDAIVRVGQFPNLYVLPAGELVANRTELLASPRWKAACATIRSQFHFTMVDAPPIDAVADYPLIQEACDHVVVIVRPDHTNRVRCMHALKKVPADKLIGVVINAVEDWFLLRNNHYHYYGYYDTYYPHKVEHNGKR